MAHFNNKGKLNEVLYSYNKDSSGQIIQID